VAIAALVPVCVERCVECIDLGRRQEDLDGQEALEVPHKLLGLRHLGRRLICRSDFHRRGLGSGHDGEDALLLLGLGAVTERADNRPQAPRCCCCGCHLGQ
jgi:hypothetical protein